MSDIFSVRNNASALFAHRQSTLNNGTLGKSLERLSSGYRINRSADDVAGMAVSEKLRTQIRGFHRAAVNTQDGISFVQTADTALQDIHDILQRMRELCVQSANGVYTDTDRSLIQQEISQLLEEIDRINTSTEFNHQRIFDYRAADIVWIVDGTGSMAGLQANLIAEAPNFVNELISRNIDYRVGVVQFGGPGNATAIGNMTTDVATFQANVTAVGTGLGPDEKGMQAYNQTLNIFSYRQSARKIFVILTDEDADDGFQPPANDIGAYADISATTAQTIAANDVVAFSVVGGAAPDAGQNNAQSEQAYYDTSGSPGVPAATGGKRFVGISAGMSATLASGIDALVENGITFHVGANENQTIDSVLQSPVSTGALGIASTVSASTQSSSENSLNYIDSAINKVTRLRSSIGAEENRLEFTLDYARVNETALQASESRIRDADMGAEIIEFTKSQVIVQAANSMLAQANLLPQNILSLLG